jgi:hypothetical protein
MVNHGFGAQRANEVEASLGGRGNDKQASELRKLNRVQPTEVAPPKIRTRSRAQDA